MTGYDFLTDGAGAVADRLGESTSVVTELDGVDLLGDTWTKQDYLALLDGGGPDIISPNAHYDFEALLPAAADAAEYYANDELVFTGDVASKGVDGTLLFTMGCHAGLSVSDVQLGFPSADWAQLYADGDNQWLAHTTYGYGDDEIVAYSERLAALFAGNVSDHLLGGADAPTSLGEAMLLAKQEYLATTFTLTPYDEKILQSWTYYGLPMYEIDGASGNSLLSEFDDAALRSVRAAARHRRHRSAGETVDANGAPVTGVSVQLTRTVGRSGPTNLNLVTTDDGNYYEVERQHRDRAASTGAAARRSPDPRRTSMPPASSSPDLTSTDVRPFYAAVPATDGRPVRHRAARRAGRRIVPVEPATRDRRRRRFAAAPPRCAASSKAGRRGDRHATPLHQHQWAAVPQRSRRPQ